MCVINSVKFATEYMDLLEAIMLPMTESETVKFMNGIGGFPAYELTTQTQIQSPAINLIEAIFEDFAIRMTLKPNIPAHGYLFSVTSSATNTEVFGVRLLAIDDRLTQLQLIFSDPSAESDTNVLVTFNLTQLTSTWTRLAIKVEQDMATLYVNCSLPVTHQIALRKEYVIAQDDILFIGSSMSDVKEEKYLVSYSYMYT